MLAPLLVLDLGLIRNIVSSHYFVPSLVTESEFRDRTDFSPPGKYMELIQKLPEWSKYSNSVYTGLLPYLYEGGEDGRSYLILTAYVKYTPMLKRSIMALRHNGKTAK